MAGTRYKNSCQTEGEPEETNIVADIFDWLEAAVASVLAVIVVFTFLFRVVGVDGESMQNTLQHKDKVIISHLFYKPEAGDIVVISRKYNNEPAEDTSQNKPIIKRVIAVGGDLVDLDYEKQQVIITRNGVSHAFVEPPDLLGNMDKKSAYIDFPAQVPEGSIFVMGDHRNNSLDSRYESLGMIDERYVLGKAVFRIWPLTGIGGLSYHSD
ncbi:MAG: signal peptidase I [Oscillospiraceae bacterium]|jgi:signal peptidase I|nr:signal peptidase I [Oscillospiraceae bacterium]